MRVAKCNDNLTQDANQLNGWDRVIYDAEERLMEAEPYVAKLKVALRIFKKLKAAGEPFPSNVPFDATPKDQPTNA